MALTAVGSLLTQAQQRAQLTLRAGALRDALRLYPAWDLENIDETWEPFMTGLLAVLERYHQLSATQAGAYYTTLRTVEGAPGTTPVRLAAFDRERAVANLTLLGPIFTKKAISLGRSRESERRIALSRLSGVVTAIVMAGGRETIFATQADDPAARGYRRVITGTCEFCRGLAAGGADVGEFKAHSHCACTAEPVFGDEDARQVNAQSSTMEALMGNRNLPDKAQVPIWDPDRGVFVELREVDIDFQLGAASPEMQQAIQDVVNSFDPKYRPPKVTLFEGGRLQPSGVYDQTGYKVGRGEIRINTALLDEPLERVEHVMRHEMGHSVHQIIEDELDRANTSRFAAKLPIRDQVNEAMESIPSYEAAEIAGLEYPWSVWRASMADIPGAPGNWDREAFAEAVANFMEGRAGTMPAPLVSVVEEAL